MSNLTAQYGQAKEGGLNDETAAQLAPEIAQLAALETQAQLAYFRGLGRRGIIFYSSN